MSTGQVSVDWNGGSWTMFYERDGHDVLPLAYEHNGIDAEPPSIVEDLLARAAHEPDPVEYED